MTEALRSRWDSCTHDVFTLAEILEPTEHKQWHELQGDPKAKGFRTELAALDRILPVYLRPEDDGHTHPSWVFFAEFHRYKAASFEGMAEIGINQLQQKSRRALANVLPRI